MDPDSKLASPLRLAVLISGGGTTMLNLQSEILAGRLNAVIVRVIASRSQCGGLEKARSLSLPVEIVARKSFDTAEQYSEAVFNLCRNDGVNLVVCAGFLALLKIPSDFQHRVMNIHPSLVPAFAGKGFHGHHVHEGVLERGCRITGCTVHFVDDEYDHGPIIVQRAVPVHDEDTADSLAARVFEQECLAYPEAIRLFAAGCLKVQGRRVLRQS